MKDTVLITGANSFIAKHLIPLLQSKFNIKLLTRKPTNTLGMYITLPLILKH